MSKNHLDGYMGRVLRVDLSKNEIWDEALNPAYARDFVGGSGLAARYLYDMVDAQTDPLGPDNPLIFMTGPMVGTSMPSAGRYSVCALSPLTGIWGEANAGGFFGPELRFAGYDGIIITGVASHPTWLSIVDGTTVLHAADDLWGLDTYATQDRIKSLQGDHRTRVVCIGPAGEHQVKMAALINDHGRAAGRTGIGAVMGAKRLKAIGVRGHADIPIADRGAMREVVREIIQYSSEDISTMSLRLAGTAGYWDMGLMYGDVPIHYFQHSEWEYAGNLSGVIMSEQYQTRNTACYRCPIACGRETKAPSYGVDKVDGPEYETVAALGSLLMIDDLEAVIYAGHLCNQVGLDTISTGVTLGLACELAERGRLSPDKADGLDIRYGNAEIVHHLIDKMANREGFGAILAEGTDYLAEAFGVPELAATVNGLEVPMHDARAFAGMAPVYALSPRGACHMQGDMYAVDIGQGPPVELGVVPGNRFADDEEKGRTAARQQAWRTLYNAMTLCQFQNPGVDRVRRALEAITGWSLDAADMLAAGTRILALKRLINLRRGLSRRDETLPDFLTKALDGPTESHTPNLDRMIAGAYDELGWDIETGKLSKTVLESLGLTGNAPPDKV
jgi:aldehyde:ferredoxin oxidoreductase